LDVEYLGQACRSRNSAIAAEAFMNNAGLCGRGIEIANEGHYMKGLEESQFDARDNDLQHLWGLLAG
jgi:hypothetical protein